MGIGENNKQTNSLALRSQAVLGTQVVRKTVYIIVNWTIWSAAAGTITDRKPLALLVVSERSCTAVATTHLADAEKRRVFSKSGKFVWETLILIKWPNMLLKSWVTYHIRFLFRECVCPPFLHAMIHRGGASALNPPLFLCFQSLFLLILLPSHTWFQNQALSQQSQRHPVD